MTTHAEPYTFADYQTMLDNYGLHIADSVGCTYRTTSPRQWWASNDWTGIIELPGTDPADWNTYNSELTYCVECHKAKVTYAHNHPNACQTSRFIQFDRAEELLPACMFDAYANLPAQNTKEDTNGKQ